MSERTVSEREGRAPASAPLTDRDVRRIVREEIKQAIHEYATQKLTAERVYFSPPHE